MRESQPNAAVGQSAPSNMQSRALRYAAGELTVAEAQEFESQLEADQSAREALAEVVRLSAAVLGRSAPSPDPAVRDRIRDRLSDRVAPGWQVPRTYHGHPVLWAGLGAAVVAVYGMVAWDHAEPSSSPRPTLQQRGPAPHAESQRVTPMPTANELPAEPAAANQIVERDPDAPTTELTAKSSMNSASGKAVEDDGKWKQR